MIRGKIEEVAEFDNGQSDVRVIYQQEVEEGFDMQAVIMAVNGITGTAPSANNHRKTAAKVEEPVLD